MSKSTVVQFGSNYIQQLDDKPGVLFWTSPLAIDADGHPQAYHPQGSPPGPAPSELVVTISIDVPVGVKVNVVQNTQSP